MPILQSALERLVPSVLRDARKPAADVGMAAMKRGVERDSLALTERALKPFDAGELQRMLMESLANAAPSPAWKQASAAVTSSPGHYLKAYQDLKEALRREARTGDATVTELAGDKLVSGPTLLGRLLGSRVSGMLPTKLVGYNLESLPLDLVKKRVVQENLAQHNVGDAIRAHYAIWDPSNGESRKALRNGLAQVVDKATLGEVRDQSVVNGIVQGGLRDEIGQARPLSGDGLRDWNDLISGLTAARLAAGDTVNAAKFQALGDLNPWHLIQAATAETTTPEAFVKMKNFLKTDPHFTGSIVYRLQQINWLDRVYTNRDGDDAVTWLARQCLQGPNGSFLPTKDEVLPATAWFQSLSPEGRERAQEVIAILKQQVKQAQAVNSAFKQRLG